MPTIISIDTSSDTASVALLQNGTVKTLSHDGFSTHSMTVIPMLQQLLADTSLNISDCDAIAFGCGPGSFTGLRTACGIVQGISFGIDIPVIPVITLEAMAESCRRINGKNSIISVLDARMHEVYWAEYAYENGEWKTITAPQLSAASEITARDNVAYCGNGLSAYAEDLQGIVKNCEQFPEIYPYAESIAFLGEKKYLKGEYITPEMIQPLYLRNKVALKTAERLALKENKHE